MQPSGNLQIGLITEPGHDRSSQRRRSLEDVICRETQDVQADTAEFRHLNLRSTDPLPGGTIVFCRAPGLCLGETTFSLDCSRFCAT